MRRLLLGLVPVAVLVLAACGSADDGAGDGDGSAAAPTSAAADGGSGDPAAGDTAQADNDLQVEIDLGEGAAPQTWTLTCVGFVEGSHPAAQAACDHLAGLERPFAPLSDDVLCTQIYGGPETAHVLGRWAGEPVDLTLSRTDGCRIDQWNGLVPLVPAPAS